MSRQIIVKALSGFHLGMRVTVTTANTTATGVLQGFQHEAVALNAGNFIRDEWVTGRRETTITLLPNQEIIAELGDKVVVHDEGLRRYAAGGFIKDGDPGTSPWPTKGDEPSICDNRNAQHQAEMNGEKP